MLTSLCFRLKEGVSLGGMKFATYSLPFSMKSLVETELHQMLNFDIIYLVENLLTSASIVLVKKQAGASRPIRICNDCSE